MSQPKSTGVRKSDTQNKRAQAWLKPEQVDAMRDAALSTGATYLRERNDVAIGMLYDLGLRVGELVALDIDDLDLDSRELYLPSHKQKDYPDPDHSPPPAYMDIDRNLARDIQRYLSNRWKDPEALFPSRQDDRATTQSIRRVVRAAAETANVRPFLEAGGRGDPSDVGPHTLRHSVAYRMIRVEGARMVEVRDRLRHSSIATTEQIYEHF